VINREIALRGSTRSARRCIRHRRAVHSQLRHRGAEEEVAAQARDGELIGAIAMSEPAPAPTCRACAPRAKKSGNGYVLNGSKTFITNGQHANLIIVVAKTDPRPAPRAPR
jgi:acyl-CoA dehydrogenase